MSEITPERIAELLRKWKLTTQAGDWYVDADDEDDFVRIYRGHGFSKTLITDLMRRSDADGVVAARNALPDLLDEIERLQERVDLDVDEFQRIKAELDPLLVGLHGTMPEAISKCVASLCDRAVTAGRQRVPLIEQRDRAEAEARRLRVENDNLRSLLPKAFDAGVQSDWTRMDRDEWVANALKEIEQ